MKTPILLTFLLAGLTLTSMGCAPVASQSTWQNALQPPGEPSPQLTLARGGQTDYVIVIPTRPSDPEKKAAQELSYWLGEITGTHFSIVPDRAPPQPREISVGQTTRLQEAAFAEPPVDLGWDGYTLDVRDERLYLFGGRRGPINAVFALLEEDLGCRWYTPDVKRIPERPTLKVKPVPRSYAPQMYYRRPYTTHAGWSEFALRNRSSAAIPEVWGGSYDWGGYHNHTFGRLVPLDKYWDEHPEYYSLIDGERTRELTQLCVTNPEVIDIATRDIQRQLEERSTAEAISISQNDYEGRNCQCDNCRAVVAREGGETGLLLHFVNAVAQRIKKSYPEVLITTLAYLETVSPPKHMKALPNVGVRLCTDQHAWSRLIWDITKTTAFSSATKDWADYCEHLLIWDYAVNFNHYLTPTPNIPVLAANLRIFRDHKVGGYFVQTNETERREMKVWILKKLLWDPSRSAWELMHDFVHGYFGAAAAAVAEYNEARYTMSANTNRELLWGPELEGRKTPAWMLEDLGPYGARFKPTAKYLTREFLEACNEIFDRAEAMAENEEILQRVQTERLPIIYTELYQIEMALKNGERLEELEYFRGLIDRFEEIAPLSGRDGHGELGERGRH